VIVRDTTLILGAGASAPYGFPVGSGLREKIISETLHTFPQLERSRSIGEIDRFRNAFRDSGVPSIDAFLQERQEFEKYGTLAIAATLLPCEQIEKLHNNDWYQLLADALFSRPIHSTAEAKRLKIVTFNYDRSLEYFLHTAAMHRFGLSRSDAAAKVTSLVEIVHVYGDFGQLPEYCDNDDSIEFGCNRHDLIISAAKKLRIISRGDPNSDEFTRARAMIAQSDFVCFLGFGFLAENVVRLQLHELPRQKVIFSSGFNIQDGRRQRLSHEYQNHLKVFMGHSGLNGHGFLEHTDLLGWISTINTQSDLVLDRLNQTQAAGRLLT
jgi:hypothetical protein